MSILSLIFASNAIRSFKLELKGGNEVIKKKKKGNCNSLWMLLGTRLATFYPSWTGATQPCFLSIRLVPATGQWFRYSISTNLKALRLAANCNSIPASEEWYSKPVPASIWGCHPQYRYCWYSLISPAFHHQKLLFNYVFNT